MNWFRNVSISWKLTLLAVFTSVLVLVATAVAFSVIDLRMTKADLIESYSSTADLFGQNCVKALVIDDANDANTVLSWMRLDTRIALAVLYDTNHQEFASFCRSGNKLPGFDHVREMDGLFGHDGYLHLVHPVKRSDGKVVGTLYLRVELARLWLRVRSQAHLMMLVLFGSIALSIGLAVWKQRLITKPIFRLVETAHRIVQSGDYSLRAKNDSADEFGKLVDEFNLMLTAIENRDLELSQHREHLTELVQARTIELERKTKEAMAASVAKSDFLANMSHEIRTPLNAIIGYTDLLQRGWSESPEEHDEMLATIHSSGRHLLMLIDDILDLSKIESGLLEIDLQPESPHTILSEVVSMMRVPFREKNLTLDYNWEGLVPATIETDGHRLRQILINLLGNARKFTPSGGVQIIARVIPDLQSPQLVIDVVDTGVGIPHNKQSQIFEPFMQADTSVTRQFGGTGLGLAISRRLARMMRGDLTVESSPGNGSDFRVAIATGDLTNIPLLPLNTVGDVIPNSSDGSCQSDAVHDLAGFRVLLVDDGESNRRLISLILKRAKATLTEACNGQQACDLALGKNNFDVILLDMQMPIMDGYTTAATMRAAGLNTPIIALTAHAMSDDRDKSLNAGCSDFLTKPVSAEELLERLQLLYDSLTILNPCTAEASILQEPIRSKLPIDDPEFAAIVIDFIPVLQREVDRMTTAIHNRDPVETLTASHWIKGAAGTAGFSCFTNPAIEITKNVRANDWTDVDRLLMTIQDYVKRIESPDSAVTSA